MKKKATDFLLMTFGTILVSVGTYFFKFPNHFSFGGVSGLSVVLGQAFPFLSPGAWNTIFSLLFLVLGFVFLDRGFGFKTVYCSLLFAGLTQGLEYIFPLAGPLTDQKMLELIFAAALPAVGSAILFNIDASSGGTDILAMIMRKFTRLNIGKALLLSDAVIALSALFVFDIQTGLYSIVGLVMKSFLVDMVIENINMKKSFTIVTTHPEEVCEFINKNLHRGATIWQAKGAFTDKPHWVILSVMSRMQAAALRNYVKNADAHAFMLISNATTIVGKGFREM